MEKNELVQLLLSKEWEMFHNVNGDERSDCQDDYRGFVAMRKAMYDAWDEDTLRSYLADLENAEAAGINLAREKYIRMMEHTAAEDYKAFEHELPPVSAEKATIVAEIWEHMLGQTLKMHDKYPVLALGGRPLRTGEEREWPSIETYQKSELLTYSEATLACYLKNLKTLEAQGVDLAYKIQENTVKNLGYSSMDEAEAAMAKQFMELMMSQGSCTTCGCVPGSC